MVLVENQRSSEVNDLRLTNTQKKSKTTLKLVIFSFFNIFIIYRINILFLPFYMEILGVIGLVILLFNRKHLTNFVVKIFIVILALIIWAFATIILHSSEEYSYIKFLFSLIYKIGLTYFSFYIFKKTFKQDATLKTYFKSYVLSSLLYFFSTLLLIMFEPLNKFWVGTVVPRNPLVDEGYFFRISISGFSGFDEVSLYAISLFMAAYLISDCANLKKNNGIYKAGYIVLSLGCLLYGRISLVSIALSLIALFFMHNSKKRAINFFVFLILLFLILFVSFWLVSLVNEMFSHWFKWACEPLLSLFSGTDIGSLESLKDMFIMPPFRTFLFGDGQYLDGTKYYMGIDVGYLRAIYFYGILGLLMNAYLIFILMRKIRIFFPNKEMIVTLIVLGLNILIYEFKGVMWDSSILYLMFIIFLGIDRKHKNREAIYNVDYKNAV